MEVLLKGLTAELKSVCVLMICLLVSKEAFGLAEDIAVYTDWLLAKKHTNKFINKQMFRRPILHQFACKFTLKC